MFPERQLVLGRRVEVVLRDRLHRYRRRRQKNFFDLKSPFVVVTLATFQSISWIENKTCFLFHFFDFQVSGRF